MKNIGRFIESARAVVNAFRHVATALHIVWNTRPALFMVVAALSLSASAIPVTNLWIGKHLLDAVAQAVSRPNIEGTYRQMVWLLALQVLLAGASAFLNGLNGSYKELLMTDVQNRSVLMILRKAVSLDLEHFERSETHDTLRTALGQVGSRPVMICLQLVSVGQSLLVLGSVGALMSRLGLGVFLIVALAAVPGVLVANRFGVLSYRQGRRRAPELRAQNYLASLLTSEHAAKEIRAAGTEEFLLGRWEHYRRRITAEIRELSVARTTWTVVASITSTALIIGATLSVVRQAAAGQISVGEFSVLTMGIGYVQSQLAAILAGVAGLYE